MNKNYKYLLLALMATSCMSYTQESSRVVPMENDGLTASEEVPLEEEVVTVLDNPERPLDIAPLVSNYLAARMSENEGRTSDAAYFYDQAEAADPENADLKERAFSLQLAIGNVEEAIRLAKAMEAAGNTLPMAHILLGADALVNGELDKADKFLAEASSASPMLLQFHVLKAYIALEKGESLESAVKMIEDAPKVTGLAPLRHYHLGRLYDRADVQDKAQQYYELAYEGDRSSSFIILALERFYERTNQQDKLKAVFERFMRENPDNVMLLKSIDRLNAGESFDVEERPMVMDAAEVMFEVATLMSGQKLPTSASQLVNISLWLNPEDDFVNFYKGLLQEQAEAYEHAVATYRSLDDDAYTWLGGQIRISDILVKQGRLDEAVKYISRLSNAGDYPILQRILAELYYTQKDYEKAIAVYDKLLKEEDEGLKKPDLTKFAMYFARGTAHERLANYDKAEKDLMESIRLDPNNATALNYLGYMWLEQRGDEKLDDAFSLIGRALLIRPNDAAILDSMGWVLYLKGEYQQASKFLEKAAEHSPNDATINMHLGDVYEKLGRYQESLTHWQRALKLGPDTTKDAQYLRAKVNKVSAKLK